mmetsp:Transcript_5563/g.18477  ORF Transcript_5563/g.18477 Transcript_5563/m.18477 type:complete len:316 (-) Transcript_5563:360-1307(-)
MPGRTSPVGGSGAMRRGRARCSHGRATSSRPRGRGLTGLRPARGVMSRSGHCLGHSSGRWPAASARRRGSESRRSSCKSGSSRRLSIGWTRGLLSTAPAATRAQIRTRRRVSLRCRARTPQYRRQRGRSPQRQLCTGCARARARRRASKDGMATSRRASGTAFSRASCVPKRRSDPRYTSRPSRLRCCCRRRRRRGVCAAPTRPTGPKSAATCPPANLGVGRRCVRGKGRAPSPARCRRHAPSAVRSSARRTRRRPPTCRRGYQRGWQRPCRTACTRHRRRLRSRPSNWMRTPVSRCQRVPWAGRRLTLTRGLRC